MARKAPASRKPAASEARSSAGRGDYELVIVESPAKAKTIEK
jgi:reverse gyrase